MQERMNLARQLRNTNLFRSLNGKEQEAVNLVDNRDVSLGTPNNKVLITCEHASNDIKYVKLDDHEDELSRSQEYFDIGAADFSYRLSEELKCLSVLANYCKLIGGDPSKSLNDSQLIRHTYN